MSNCSSGTQNAISTTLLRIFRKKCNNRSLKVRNWYKNSLSFSKLCFYLKMIVWTPRMQFWQPCRIFFSKSSKIFKFYNFFSKTIFSSKCSSGHVECNFDISLEISSAKSAKSFRSKPENQLKIVFFFHQFFPFQKMFVWINTNLPICRRMKVKKKGF